MPSIVRWFVTATVAVFLMFIFSLFILSGLATHNIFLSTFAMLTGFLVFWMSFEQMKDDGEFLPKSFVWFVYCCYAVFLPLTAAAFLSNPEHSKVWPFLVPTLSVAIYGFLFCTIFILIRRSEKMDVDEIVRMVRGRPVIGCASGCDREEMETPYIRAMVSYIKYRDLLRGRGKKESIAFVRMMWGNLERYFCYDSTLTSCASRSPEATASRLVALSTIEAFGWKEREAEIKTAAAWLHSKNRSTSIKKEEKILRGLLDGSLIPKQRTIFSKEDDCEGCPTCC